MGQVLTQDKLAGTSHINYDDIPSISPAQGMTSKKSKKALDTTFIIL